MLFRSLSNNPTVMNATPEMIVMTEPEGVSTSDGGQDDSAAHVRDMAMKASQKVK